MQQRSASSGIAARALIVKPKEIFSTPKNREASQNGEKKFTNTTESQKHLLSTKSKSDALGTPAKMLSDT